MQVMPCVFLQEKDPCQTTYFNKCTATDQIDCVCVRIKMFYNRVYSF